MVLHANNVSDEVQRVITQSPDIDVLCVSHYDATGCNEMWFHTGVKNRSSFISVHSIAITLGPQMCKALPTFHPLTGCDSTSSLSGVGKKNTWKSISNTVHQEGLAGVGQFFEVNNDTTKKTEAFICSLYIILNKTPADADDARHLTFCQIARTNMLLPPPSDSLF